eukprot:jgi/Bigna1/74570/fgenesh1_pg.29_\
MAREPLYQTAPDSNAPSSTLNSGKDLSFPSPHKWSSAVDVTSLEESGEGKGSDDGKGDGAGGGDSARSLSGGQHLDVQRPAIPEGILTEGKLEKRGIINTAYKSRYIAVTWSSALGCFELRYGKRKGAKGGEGVIPLRNSTVDGGECERDRQFELLTTQRQWRFRAESAEMKQRWVDSLRWFLLHPYERRAKDSADKNSGGSGEGEGGGGLGGDTGTGAFTPQHPPFHWLPKGYDIYAIALQECHYPHRKGFSRCEEDVCFCLVSHLGRAQYTVVKAMSMWEIRHPQRESRARCDRGQESFFRNFFLHGVGDLRVWLYLSRWVSSPFAGGGVPKKKGGVRISLSLSNPRI